jgi:hypothetical protein
MIRANAIRAVRYLGYAVDSLKFTFGFTLYMMVRRIIEYAE